LSPGQGAVSLSVEVDQPFHDLGRDDVDACRRSDGGVEDALLSVQVDGQHSATLNGLAEGLAGGTRTQRDCPDAG
jgi:hypothetical protein